MATYFTKNEIAAAPCSGVDYDGKGAKLSCHFLVKDVDVMRGIKNPTH